MVLLISNRECAGISKNLTILLFIQMRNISLISPMLIRHIGLIVFS